MATSHIGIENHKPPEDSDEQMMKMTGYMDPVEEIKKGPFYLSGCSPGQGVDPECEVTSSDIDGEGYLLSEFKDCKKNPGHKDFIPVNEFRAEHLPEHMRTEENMAGIRTAIDHTVLIRVKYTSLNRPDAFYDSKTAYPYSKIKGSRRKVRQGTGFIALNTTWTHVFGDCPCHDCEKSGNHPKKLYWKFHINTATHVIFDDCEAKHAVIKCFFDSEEDQEEVVTLYGVGIKSGQSQEEMYRSDLCDNLICITHDKLSAERLESRLRCESVVPHEGFIVSHPHGCSKTISLGKLLYNNISIKPKYEIGRPEEFPKDTICHLPPENEPISIASTILLKPGTIISLPSDTRFTLPADAEYAMMYHYDKKGFTFPSGTKFISGDGEAIPIPDYTVFETKDFETKTLASHSYFAYDIPTCPGSSGARMFGCQEETSILRYVPHCGRDGKGDCNRSGTISGEKCILSMVEAFRDVGENMRSNEKFIGNEVDRLRSKLDKLTIEKDRLLL